MSNTANHDLIYPVQFVFQGAIIDQHGNEIPITEAMIQQAHDQLQQAHDPLSYTQNQAFSGH